MKTFWKIVIVFIIGMAAAIFSEQIFWPYITKRPFFSSYQLSGEQSSQPLQKIIEKKEVVVEENTALQDAVEKVKNMIVGVETKTASGKIISGSGLIVTSDGLMVTLAELIPSGTGKFAFFVNGKMPKYQVLKRDLKNNLALVKIEESDLKTCSFADYDKTRLGERVFLIGAIRQKSKISMSVNEGIIKFFNDKYIQTNILENKNLIGSPLFNIKGELMGLNTIDNQGRVFSIPVKKIKDFIGL